MVMQVMLTLMISIKFMLIILIMEFLLKYFFRNVVKVNKHQIKYCAVRAHHQNRIVQHRIETLTLDS